MPILWGRQIHTEAKVPQTDVHPKGPDSSSRSLLQQLQAQTIDVLGAGKVLTPDICAQPKTCYTCNQKAHFSSLYFSKSVADVILNEVPTLL